MDYYFSGDERQLYIKQLLDNYKKSMFCDNDLFDCYTVKYQYTASYNNVIERVRRFDHNEGIDFVKDYISDLEKKINELQYVEKIIKEVRKH